MNKGKLVAAAALLAVSTASQAWWGPWSNNGWGDGFMDGDVGFSMNMSGHGRGNGYGNHWGAPYYGYAPYGYAPYGYAPYGHAPAAYAPTPEQMQQQMDAQREAMEKADFSAVEFQRQMNERHREMMEQRRAAFEQQMALMRGAPTQTSAKATTDKAE